MATFGSTAGQYNASRDFLAEALSNAGQTAGQAIANTGQAFAQGVQQQQALKAQQEQKKLAMMQGELDDARAEAQRLMTPGADPTQIDALYNQRRTDILGKYGMGGKPDNVATALTPTPQAPQPQAVRQPQQGDNVAAALTPGQPKAPAQQPQPQVGTERPAAPQQRPALTLSPATVYANSQANVKQAESDKNEREGVEKYRSEARKLRITDADIDSDPELKPFAGRSLQDWENIVAIANQRETDRKERMAARLERIKAGVEKVKSEDELRREYTREFTPYKDVVDKEKNVTTLLSQGSVQSDMAALKLYARMLEPGVVTEGDIRVLSKAGGVWDQIQKEVGQALTGEPLTPQARERLNAAVASVATNARTNIKGLNEHYSEIALASGRRPGQIINSSYTAKQTGADGGGTGGTVPKGRYR